MPRTFYAVLLCLVASLCAAISSRADDEGGPLSRTFTIWLRHPEITYARPAHDPVAELSREMEQGKVSLRREGAAGYLRSVLDALHVPVESQIVVFNPDSVQMRRIRPDNPRSLFFNDRVSVGWVRGGFIELASQDPEQGVIFYTLQQAFAGAPTFVRMNDECLTCHYSYSTAGVPGMLSRSRGQFDVTHRLPIAQRWGGWYVTGNAGANANLGTPLEGRFNLDGYLTPHSDLVALMVFEHQMHMMNLLTRIGWEARVAGFRRGKTPERLRAAGDDPADATVPLDAAAREVAGYMLFTGEAPLSGPIHGSTTFADEFEARGPRDAKGRSLRDFDLTTRMFRYPLSYMIYSPQFDALPAAARDAIYRELWRGLSRKNRAERTAIVEILRDTRSGLPSYFTPAR
ncbi:MAG TPA: hypothetical protein VN628_04595 [Vicinamibacterales bacterium]|nr:hypothetical protein [Vicinamibacterales bacterium]